MKRRGFLKGLAALPVAGVVKADVIDEHTLAIDRMERERFDRALHPLVTVYKPADESLCDCGRRGFFHSVECGMFK